MTVIVLFYLLVFPVRALVVVLSGYTDLLVVRRAVTGSDVVPVLLIASASTTALVESYYYMIRRHEEPGPIAGGAVPTEDEAVVKLAIVLAGISLLALAGVIAQHGGISGARAAFLAHTAAGASQSRNSTVGSLWDVFSIPTLWCCAYACLNSNASRGVRLVLTMAALIIVVGALAIFGSRLDVVLGLIGAWIVYGYSGRHFPTWLVLAALAAAVVLSQPLLSARGGATVNVRQAAWERYSRIAGYGVLDVSLAVWSEPQQVRAQDISTARWLDLPGYFVPSWLWPGRPNLSRRRLDAYIAQDVGTVNDKNAGFPATYITEAWLMGGWPGALIFSVVFGGLLGAVARGLTRRASSSPIVLLTYAFIATAAWTYYKDGDLLTTFVGQVHLAVYFLPLLWVAKLAVAARGRAARCGTQESPVESTDARLVGVEG